MMKHSMKMMLGLLMTAGIAVPTSADPSLVFSESTTTGGHTLYAFQIESDNLDGSYAVELAFEGMFVESLVNGSVNVDEQGDAIAFDGSLGYSSEEDTWIYSVFDTANLGNNPFTGGTTSGYWMSNEETQLFVSYGSGTGLGSPVDLLHIVVDPDSDVSWSGLIAQGGQNFDVSGSTVPEPGSLALLGLGGLALIRRRR